MCKQCQTEQAYSETLKKENAELQMRVTLMTQDLLDKHKTINRLQRDCDHFQNRQHCQQENLVRVIEMLAAEIAVLRKE